MRLTGRLLVGGLLMLTASCASYLVPQQTFSGYISGAAPSNTIKESSALWKKEKGKAPGPDSKILILHQGLDQDSNTHQPGIQIQTADFIRELRRFLRKSKRFEWVEIVSQTTWDGKSLEDLRRIGVIHDARYILLLSAQYDFRSFYSSVGHFVGWVPYINFVVPIYKMEGSANLECWVLDVKSGALTFTDSVVSFQKRRASSLFMDEGFRALSRSVYNDIQNKIQSRLTDWMKG